MSGAGALGGAAGLGASDLAPPADQAAAPSAGLGLPAPNNPF